MRWACLGLAALGLSAPAGADGGFVTCTWSDTAVHFLDDTLSDVGGFAAGATSPNGIGTDGSTIWTAHFTTQEVVVYDFSGTILHRWPATAALQGLEIVGSTGELALVNAVGTTIDFYDPFTGTFLRSIPAAAFTTEGITWDGARLWQLDNAAIHATDVLTGAIAFSIPNAAAGCPAGGTGIADSGPFALTLACADGSWRRVSKADGAVLSAGNNGLGMYGLKAVPGAGGHVYFFVDPDDFETAVTVAQRVSEAAWDFTPHAFGPAAGAGLVVPQDIVTHLDNLLDPWTDPGTGADLWPGTVDSVRFVSNLTPQGDLTIGADDTVFFASAGYHQDITDDFIGEGTLLDGSFGIVSGPPANDDHSAIGLEVLVTVGPGVAPGLVPVVVRVAVYDEQEAQIGEVVLDTFNGVKEFVGVLTTGDQVIGRVDIWCPGGATEGISSIALYRTPASRCFDQPPTRASGSFSDLECGACGTDTQVVAENFVFIEPASIDIIRFWGGYAPTNVPLDPDRFTLVLWDDSNGEPGNIIREVRGITPTTRRPTGGQIADGAIDEYEYTIDLEPNETLLPGVYWVEIFNDSSGCPADCGDSDGNVGVVDFLALLAQWGKPGACDFNGGGVDVVDFLELLANWGPCPQSEPTDWLWESGALDPERGIAGAAVSFIDHNQEEWSLEPALEQALALECTDNPFDCPGDGDCCLGNGSRGCSDAECCSLVCVIDPFCCQVEWDASCADEALAFPECGCGGDPCDDCGDGEVDTCDDDPGCHDCLTPVGDCVCVQEQLCHDLQLCPDGTCPPGYFCCVNTCCFEPVCMPLCGAAASGPKPGR
ncbi:MAG: YncE family protein, partial [Planctomycetota bacterium]